MNNDRLNIYKERINNFTKEQELIRRQLSGISMTRLLLFLAAAWFVYSAFRERFAGYDLLYALLTIPVFVILVLYAGKKRQTTSFLQQLIFINQNEIDMDAGGTSFLDNGHKYGPAKGFTVDLGLFGADSLFPSSQPHRQPAGREQMTKRLSAPFSQPSRYY